MSKISKNEVEKTIGLYNVLFPKSDFKILGNSNCEPYVYGLVTVRKLGDNCIQVTRNNVQRNPGVERFDKDFPKYYLVKDPFADGEFVKVPCTDDFWEKVSDKQVILSDKEKKKGNKKMLESIIRSKRMLFEYAMSNEWDWYVTFTIDPSKYDRTNLKKFYTDFSQDIRNHFRRKHCENVQYVFVPELHKDRKSWHIHGLISGLNKKHLELFQLSDKLPDYIRDGLKDGKELYYCSLIRNKFGFCIFEPVRSSEACAKYITKYITKDLERCVTEVGCKSYYASRGLNKAEVVYRGYSDSLVYDFKNEYCSKATFAYSDETLKLLCSKILDMNCIDDVVISTDDFYIDDLGEVHFYKREET